MIKIERTAQFKRDYKRELKGKHRKTIDNDLRVVLMTLLKGEPLDGKHKDHALIGNWKDHRDCHVKPDLVLIYCLPEAGDVLRLARLGSHSELGL